MLKMVKILFLPFPHANTINNLIIKQARLPIKTLSGVRRKRTAETSAADNQKSFEKLRCALCQVNATSEFSLKEHLAGHRHQLNGEAFESRKETTGPTKETTAASFPCMQHNPTTWNCSTCQANFSCESDFKNHLRNKRHKENIEGLQKEGNNVKDNCKFQEANLYEKSMPQLAKNENPVSLWICSICKAKCTSESDLNNHFRGRRHQDNIAALEREGKEIEGKSGFQKPKLSERKAQPPAEKNQKPVSRWNCSVCMLNCTSESNMESHLWGRRHQKKLKNLEAQCLEGKSTTGNREFQESKVKAVWKECVPLHA